jgi:hypothetical protein
MNGTGNMEDISADTVPQGWQPETPDIPSVQRPRPWWRLPACWLQMCGAEQKANHTHIWAECTHCGKIIAPISREAVRRYIQAEESDEAFIARMKREGYIQ